MATKNRMNDHAWETDGRYTVNTLLLKLNKFIEISKKQQKKQTKRQKKMLPE